MNFMKYWKVIRQYYKTKFKLSQSDLDMLFFMYSEDYFTANRFKEFSRIIGWDKNRFMRMRDSGWFEIFRKATGNTAAIYIMSDKGRHLVDDIYRKLNGHDLPATICNNPMIKRKARYSDKVMVDMIAEMREYNRENYVKRQKGRRLVNKPRQRQPPE